MKRREAIPGIAALGTSAVALLAFRRSPGVDLRPRTSRVLVASIGNYGPALNDLVFKAISEFKVDVRNRHVLLKPNLVEYAPDAPVNTHPVLIAAAADAFLRLGASAVTVADGPGHQRDTYVVLEGTGLRAVLDARRVRFVDLNRDAVRAVPTRTRYTDLKALWIPEAVLRADLIVSMPKVKTHHWAGVTLSMKNMFGVLPGSQYGWPKNGLHWAGIHESILDICSTVRPNFVIADAIHAMEGNGPLHGSLRHLGKIVLADDLVAADATCTRLMGLRPFAVRHLSEAAAFMGNAAAERMCLLGEDIVPASPPFAVLADFAFLQQKAVAVQDVAS